MEVVQLQTDGEVTKTCNSISEMKKNHAIRDWLDAGEVKTCDFNENRKKNKSKTIKSVKLRTQNTAEFF